MTHTPNTNTHAIGMTHWQVQQRGLLVTAPLTLIATIPPVHAALMQYLSPLAAAIGLGVY